VIFNSRPIMTTIDISILAVVLAALVFFLINAAQFKKQNLVLSQLPIIFGLIVIGGFYSYDLIIMHLFTNSMDQADAMKLMTDLHLNKSWIVKLLGTAMIVLGFLLLGRKLINIIVKLGSAEAELKIANTEMATTINERIAELQQEIAERKLAEARLAAKTVALDAAQSITDIGSWEWDLGTNTLSWSDNYYRNLGYEVGACEPTYENFLKKVHADDREKLIYYGSSESRRKQPRHIDDFRIVRPDGSLRWLEMRRRVEFDGDGKEKLSGGTLQDITKQKQTEQQRIQVLTNLADGAITISTMGIIEYVNPMAERMFGYASDEMIGSNVAMLMPEPDLSRHDDYLANYLRTGTANIIGIGRLVNAKRKDGSIFPVDLNIAETTVDGKTTYFGTVRDMTERVESEKELVQAKLDAEISNLVKSEFLANMSHELRTPLNAILGFSDALKASVFGELANDKQKEYVENIHESGGHLLDLITDILDVSAIKAGNLDLHEERVLLSDIAESSIRLVQPNADQGNIRLVNMMRGKDHSVYVDERRVKQILVNLLSNAIKFTPDDGEVTLGAHCRQDGCLALSVTDTGIGMDASGLAKAMEKFGQIENDLTPIQKGTGLGLPLSKNLIEAHGGEIEIESAPGRGTTVTICIPKDRVIP
jgi:PAS domain S-box-containing protein